MATPARVTFNVDSEIKEQASKIFKELGLTLSAGLEVYLRAVVREGGIPFPVTGTQEVQSSFSERNDS